MYTFHSLSLSLPAIQPAEAELEKSVLEQYLQEELETMRTAFQIRLSQIEKRYQRQLILEQQRNRQSPLLVRNPLVPQQRQTNTRRNSWHSCIPGNQDHDGLVMPEVRSGSSQGFDSDFSVDGSDVESDVVPVDRVSRRKKAVQFSLGGPDVYEHDSSPGPTDHARKFNRHAANSNGSHSSVPAKKIKEGLKGGNGSWGEGTQDQDSPRMSPLADLEDEKAQLSTEARDVVQQKIHQYREKMGKYFQEKSEAQIAVIEKQYIVHMDEFKRQCSEREDEKVNHLESRIKDLENMLEVRTLV
jgi:polyhydroxyalkanoate synthesis regulator phasin